MNVNIIIEKKIIENEKRMADIKRVVENKIQGTRELVIPFREDYFSGESDYDDENDKHYYFNKSKKYRHAESKTSQKKSSKGKFKRYPLFEKKILSKKNK